MNIVKNIVLVLLVTGVTVSFADDTKKDADATLKLTGGSVAAGIGFSWASGTLTYHGKEYPVKVSGLSLGKVGTTDASASGQVYNLKKVEDFDGHFNAGALGATLAGGRNAIAMTNENDVEVRLESNTRGVDVTVAGGRSRDAHQEVGRSYLPA